MSFIVPPSKNYTTPLVSLPCRFGRVPPEGNRMVPVEVDWATMGGPGQCVALNLQNNATDPVSQILALSVDNSQCGNEIQFVFNDTQDTLTIPAYAPKTICEVFTNQTQFIVQAFGTVTSGDITRFSILNFVPPPINVPEGVEQEIASVDTIAFDGASTTAIIPAGVSGTIESLQLFVTNAAALEDFHYLAQLQDGATTPNVIARFQLDLKSGNAFSGVVVSYPACAIRFQNGLNLVQTRTIGTMNEGFISGNILYRSP